MISYTPAVVFGLLRGELVMMRSQQSNLNLVLIKIVETISIMDVKEQHSRFEAAESVCTRPTMLFLFFETSTHILLATLMNEKCVVCTIHNSNVDRSLFEGLNQTNSKDLGYLGYIPYYPRVWNIHRAGNKHRA